MSYSSLIFGQQLHVLDCVKINTKIRFYKKLKKRILLTDYDIILLFLIKYVYTRENKMKTPAI